MISYQQYFKFHPYLFILCLTQWYIIKLLEEFYFRRLSAFHETLYQYLQFMLPDTTGTNVVLQYFICESFLISCLWFSLIWHTKFKIVNFYYGPYSSSHKICYNIIIICSKSSCWRSLSPKYYVILTNILHIPLIVVAPLLPHSYCFNISPVYILNSDVMLTVS